MTEGTASDTTIGPFHREVLVVTLTILALVTVTAFETMAVSTAMPDVARDLGFVRTYGFAFSVLMTTQLIGIVLAGVWADRSGPIPGTFAGQVLLAGGSALCGFADSSAVFLLGRGLTGLGGGLLVVMMYIIAGRVYTDAVRPTLFVYISAAWILPSLIGGPIAGWLATEFSWRWVFWVIVLPAGVAGGLLLLRREALRAPAAHASDVPDADPTQERRQHRRTARLGAIVAGSAGVVQLAIHERPDVASVLGAAAALGLVGVAIAAPKLLPPGTFRSARGLPSVVLTRALLNGSFLGAFAYLPLMLTQEKGLDPTSAGLVLAAGSLGWSAGSWAQGRSRRSSVDERADLVVWGATLLAVGWALFVALTVGHAPVWSFAVVIVVGGLGMGLGSTTLSGLVLELSPDHEHGRASAALQLADVLGTVIGIAGATAAFGAWHRVGEHRGFVIVWLGLAAFGALGILTASRCATGTSRTREDVPVRSL